MKAHDMLHTDCDDVKPVFFIAVELFLERNQE